MKPLILASASPIRLKLLQQAGIAVRVEPARIDERAIEARLQGEEANPRALALTLAREKALDVARQNPESLVIGADQTLDLHGQSLHKTGSLEAAAVQLQRLQGETHRLHAAYAIAFGGEIVAEKADTAEMAMRALSGDEIAAYLEAAGERVLSSVGTYQLEAEGVRLFTAIRGDYFTVLGLPMPALCADLRRLGALPW